MGRGAVSPLPVRLRPGYVYAPQRLIEINRLILDVALVAKLPLIRTHIGHYVPAVIRGVGGPGLGGGDKGTRAGDEVGRGVPSGHLIKCAGVRPVAAKAHDGRVGAVRARRARRAKGCALASLKRDQRQVGIRRGAGYVAGRDIFVVEAGNGGAQGGAVAGRVSVGAGRARGVIVQEALMAVGAPSSDCAVACLHTKRQLAG